MWACWDSRRLVVGALLAAALFAPVTAEARVTVRGVVLGDSIDAADGAVRVSRGRKGSSADVNVALGDDTLGHGALVIDNAQEGLVRVLADAHVKPGERLDGDVVAVFGDVKIEGHVTGAAVAVFGHVTVAPGASVGSDAVAVVGSLNGAGPVNGNAVAVLGSVNLAAGATVDGDAVAVGGRVEEDAQARIVGQSVSVGLLPITLGLPTLAAVLATIGLGWLLTLFFGWLFALMFPTRLARVGVTASRQTFLSIVVAMLSVVLWPVVAILIMATIIGVPVGLVLWFAYPLVVYAGQLGATYVLGSKLLRRRLGEGNSLAPLAAGSAFIAMLFALAAVSFSFGGAGGAVALFFGVVGLLVLCGLTAIGTGAFLISRAGSHPPDVGRAEPAAGATPA